MGVLEQVTQMRNQGKTDEEIISDLKKQKVSPKEINDALNHEKIRSAVSDVRGDNQGMAAPPAPSMSEYPQSQESPFPDQNYEPQYPENQQYPQGGYSQQGYGQEAYPESQQYPQDQYGQQGNYYQQGYDQQESSTDKIVEIADQVFEEKSREIGKKIDSLEELKTLTQSKLNHLSEKVKRIESVLDHLQAAILEKVGSYGQDLGSIKKEMSMMQDTFGKAMSASAARTKRSAEKKSEPKKSRKKQ